MKICVFFQPKDKYDNFEGMRLRKSIKGALELVDVPYSRNIIDNYDIIHFVSPDDELKINDAIEELGYVAVGYDNTGPWLEVIIDKN